MLPLRSVFQEQIEDFAFVATHVNAVAAGFAYLLDDAVGLPVVALVLGERYRERFQESFDGRFQNSVTFFG